MAHAAIILALGGAAACVARKAMTVDYQSMMVGIIYFCPWHGTDQINRALIKISALDNGNKVIGGRSSGEAGAT